METRPTVARIRRLGYEKITYKTAYNILKKDIKEISTIEESLEMGEDNFVNANEIWQYYRGKKAAIKSLVDFLQNSQ